jgi:hypothetical protein
VLRALLPAVLFAGCSARAGGALPHARPPAEVPAAAEAGPTEGAEGIDALARSPFFRGAGALTAALPRLASTATARGVEPEVVTLRGVDVTVARGLSASGRRAPKILLALGFSAHVRRTPKECADALTDPATLKRTLDADDARALDGDGGAPRRGRAMSVALLRRGKGPFRFDFRWAFRVERLDLPSGSVLLRYELLANPPAERVSAFAGVVVLEHDAKGTRITEALVLGTDVSVPFFLMSAAKKGVADILDVRATRLVRSL